jgi:PHD/YefM family antitoxin component YafN of YafNO toxin-antitoxin module
MSNADLLDSVQFVVDSGGHKSAVLLNLDVWERVLTLLEDLDDAEEIRRARAEDKEPIPWKRVKTDLGLGS